MAFECPMNKHANDCSGVCPTNMDSIEEKVEFRKIRYRNFMGSFYKMHPSKLRL